LNYCDRTAISAVFPLIRSDLHASDLGLAAIGSVFLWSYAIGSLFAGWLSDRVSRARVIAVSLAAWSAVTVWTGLARSLNELLATRVLLGLAESAYLPAAVALLADHHQPGRRGAAIGIHTAGLSFGTVAGATLAGYLGERFGWRSTFLLLGCLGICLAFVAAAVLRRKEIRPAPAQRTSGSGFASVLPRVPTYWLLLAQSMVASVGVWTFMLWLPLYFQETFSMSLAGAGFSSTFLLQVPGVLGVAAGGYISDSVARRDSTARMLLQSVSYLVATPLVLLFSAGAALAFTAGAVVGFSVLRSIALANENPLLCDLIPSSRRSSAIGLMNAANCFAGGLGVLAAGYFKRDYGLAGAFTAVSILTLTCAALTGFGYFVLLRRDLQRQNQRSH
jgi:MFS transporter, Spinster family, sphingosine-1-phosphate transporter